MQSSLSPADINLAILRERQDGTALASLPTPRMVSMEVSRRGFLRASAAVAGGTALGGLTGLGANLAPTLARAAELRIKDARTFPSICPYCSVGCATLVHTVDDKIVNIEGDPRSPFNEGTLCPKG